MKKITLLLIAVFSFCVVFAQERLSVVDDLQRTLDNESFLEHLREREISIVIDNKLYLVSEEPNGEKGVGLYSRYLNSPGISNWNLANNNPLYMLSSKEEFIPDNYHGKFGSSGSVFERLQTSLGEQFLIILTINDGTNTYRHISLMYVVRERSDGFLQFSHNKNFFNIFNKEKHYFGISGFDQVTNTFKGGKYDNIETITFGVRPIKKGKEIKAQQIGQVKYEDGTDYSYNMLRR